MDIATSREGGVLEIAFNRPQKKNALSAAMYAAAAAALREADADEAVRVVLFRGEGDSFCAGNDLEDFASNPPVAPDAPVFQFLAAGSRAVKAAGGGRDGLRGRHRHDAAPALRAGVRRRGRPFPASVHAPGHRARVRVELPAAAHRRISPRGRVAAAGRAVRCEEGVRVRLHHARAAPVAVLDAAREAARALASLPPKSIQRTKALMRRPHAAAVQAQLKAEIDEFGPMLFEPARVPPSSASSPNARLEIMTA
jgi:enoyl-CoA hydratase/carnithine racemase